MKGRELQISTITILFVLLLTSLILVSRAVGASMSTSPSTKTYFVNQAAADGFDSLPPGSQARSMSSLVKAGLVHPYQKVSNTVERQPPYRDLPLSTINWGSPINISAESSGNPGSNEPGVAMHPINPLFALVGGNSSTPASQPVRIENSSDGGLTWTRRVAPNQYPAADGVPGWLPNGNTALFTSLFLINEHEAEIRLSQSNDGGASWNSVTGTNINVTGYNNDRAYLWTDYNLSGRSACPGSVYLTETLLSIDGSQDYDTVGVRRSTDGGNMWSTFHSLIDPSEYSRNENHNSIATMAIQPDGGIVVVWHRGRCCTDPPVQPVNVPNKIMWARSTDCGDTFTSPGIIYTVPLEQSVPFNSSSPSSPYFFRWSDDPNVAADPADGTLYAVWTAYRSSTGDPSTAGVYLSRGTPDATVWTPPVLVNNDFPNKFQYYPWVQISPDHVVHVTYSAVAPNGNSNTEMAHFYVQSTDRGQTFSTPFRLNELNSGIYGARGFMGDYEAMNIGGYTSDGQATILAAWTDTYVGNENRWGRFGTFQFPTPTPTPPTTPTPAATPCPVQFQDIVCNTRFYRQVRCLYEGGIVSGYPCGGVGEPCLPPGNLPYYRPDNNLTRGQLSKMVALAANFIDPLPSTRQTFEDVPSSNPFWVYIERVALHNIVQGYPCGDPGEPCVAPGNRPYFRPYNNATRGQLTKMVSLAAGWTPPIPSTQQTYEDVPPSSTFWLYVEREKIKSALNGFGYACGGPGEPCVPPNNRLYFRPYSNATRGEAASVTSITFFGRCGLDDGTDSPPVGAPGSAPSTVISPTAPPITPTAGSTATSTVFLPSPIPTAPLPSPLPTGPVPTVGGTK